MGVTAIAGVSTRNGGKGPRDRPDRPRPPYAVAPGVSSEARTARGEQAGRCAARVDFSRADLATFPEASDCL